MSILDDAIREHLELKRQHGADEAEVKRLEDEAFGPPGRPEEPDPMAEAPTAFMATPEAPEAEAPSPSDEEIVEAEAAEPRLAPVEPATEIHAIRTAAPEEAAADEEDEDDDFWSEQRLSDELDQALEAPLSEEPVVEEE